MGASTEEVRALRLIRGTLTGVLVGATMGVVGLGLALLDTDPQAGRGGIALLAAGGMLAMLSILNDRTAPAEQMYRHGYDVGYEHGIEEGHRASLRVVTRFSEERREEGRAS